MYQKEEIEIQLDSAGRTKVIVKCVPVFDNEAEKVRYDAEQWLRNEVTKVLAEEAKFFCLGKNLVFRETWIKRLVSIADRPIFDSASREFLKIIKASSVEFLQKCENSRCTGACWYSATHGCRGCIIASLYDSSKKKLTELLARRSLSERTGKNG